MKNQFPTVGFVSLGCPKALVDSERIITQLRAESYEIVPSYQQADVVIVNTCGFIDSAVEESMQAIDEALAENGKVIVTGCLGVKKDLLQSKFPNLLHVTGPQAYEDVMMAVHDHVPPAYNPHTSLIPDHGVKLTPKHYAYLKISEGCNHKCTFCIIPSMRGKLVSRPIGEVMTEAESLAKSGVKELLVISQDTSAYGLDLKYQTGFWQGRPIKTRFYELANALGELGIWVRLHYVYPYPHVDEVIPLMAEGKILPYLDIPFQHASPSVLKDMRRPAFAEKSLERIQKWRSICPDIAIRSTFIVGFPGETEDDFEQLLEFVKAAELDRVGCFQYSPVEGAKANELANPVPDEIKQERYERFMLCQQQVSEARLQRQVGRQIEVMVDGRDDGALICRSKYDAPEIDGNVYIEDNGRSKPGDIIAVEVTEATEYDLLGVEISQ